MSCLKETMDRCNETDDLNSPMYLYETHLHTFPISACGKAGVRESLEYYKSAGYAGVFMTDHFIDANFDRSAREWSYADRIKRYFSAYEEGRLVGEEIGLSVFYGFEMAHRWAHILVYGIDEEWCLSHPDMDKMKKSELLTLLREDGALLIQAHPFRTVETEIILYPNHVHGVEIYNGSRGDFENKLAVQYAENYGLLPFAGSDNHRGGDHERGFGGIATQTPIQDAREIKDIVIGGKYRVFARDENGFRYL